MKLQPEFVNVKSEETRRRVQEMRSGEEIRRGV